MSILHKAIYRLQSTDLQSLSKYAVFFTELEQKNPKIGMETWKTSNSQSNTEKEQSLMRYHNPKFPEILQSYNIKTVWYCCKNTYKGQWNRIVSQKKRYMHREREREREHQLIYDSGGQNIQWRKDTLFNNWCWENWIATCIRMKQGHFLELYTKTISK